MSALAKDLSSLRSRSLPYDADSEVPAGLHSARQTRRSIAHFTRTLQRTAPVPRTLGRHRMSCPASLKTCLMNRTVPISIFSVITRRMRSPRPMWPWITMRSSRTRPSCSVLLCTSCHRQPPSRLCIVTTPNTLTSMRLTPPAASRVSACRCLPPHCSRHQYRRLLAQRHLARRRVLLRPRALHLPWQLQVLQRHQHRRYHTHHRRWTQHRRNLPRLRAHLRPRAHLPQRRRQGLLRHQHGCNHAHHHHVRRHVLAQPRTHLVPWRRRMHPWRKHRCYRAHHQL
mmetsp:Transcript_81420/g.211674  ORF Transcript_81420/g.211674 Transcript_81420/m.211674 type:complete len:284 (-) Transcript_81420:430-1281(-)